MLSRMESRLEDMRAAHGTSHCALCGFAQTVYFARGRAFHSAFAHVLEVWNGSLFILSLATNVTVTIFIVLRIW